MNDDQVAENFERIDSTLKLLRGSLMALASAFAATMATDPNRAEIKRAMKDIKDDLSTTVLGRSAPDEVIEGYEELYEIFEATGGSYDAIEAEFETMEK